MKKLLTLIILIPCISIAQWNYGNTSKGRGVYANGKIDFREFEDFEFKLVKYKDVEDLKSQLLLVLSSRFSSKKMSSTIKKYHPNEIMKYYVELLNSFI